MLMVGGNIYAYAGYSIGYQLNPIPRFAMMTCTNATTGDITWTLNGGVFPVAAADGYVLGVGIKRWKPLLHRQRPNNDDRYCTNSQHYRWYHCLDSGFSYG